MSHPLWSYLAVPPFSICTADAFAKVFQVSPVPPPVFSCFWPGGLGFLLCFLSSLASFISPPSLQAARLQLAVLRICSFIADYPLLSIPVQSSPFFPFRQTLVNLFGSGRPPVVERFSTSPLQSGQRAVLFFLDASLPLLIFFFLPSTQHSPRFTAFLFAQCNFIRPSNPLSEDAPFFFPSPLCLSRVFGPPFYFIHTVTDCSNLSLFLGFFPFPMVSVSRLSCPEFLLLQMFSNVMKDAFFFSPQ